ncbi:MAG: response regulator [Deferribacterales bacterium]
MSCFINILIAEDDQLNRMMLEKLLNKFDAVCTMAKDGREAMEMFEQGSFDSVFLDVNMPVYTGPECAVMIKKASKAKEMMPPLLVCISADEEYSEDGSFDFFLEKPFNLKKIKELTEAIAACKCTDKPYDIKHASEIIGLDEETMRMLMKEFLTVFDEEIANLKNAIAENSPEDITHVAHKMKGAAANMQAESLCGYCSKMQSADKNNTAELNMLYSRIYCSYCFFKNQLNS